MTPASDRNETCPTCGSVDRAERFSVDERGEVRDPFLGNPGFTQPCDDEWHATPPSRDGGAAKGGERG